MTKKYCYPFGSASVCPDTNNLCCHWCPELKKCTSCGKANTQEWRKCPYRISAREVLSRKLIE